MNCQPPGFTFKALEINYCQYRRHGFSVKKVINIRYFYVLNVDLGGLLFMKFNITENSTV